MDFDRDLGIFVGVIFGWITSVSVIVTNNITIFQKIMIIVMKKIKKISIGIHINLTDDPLLMCNSRSLYKNYFKSEKNKYIFWKNAISNETYLKRIKKEIMSQFSMFKTKFKSQISLFDKVI